MCFVLTAALIVMAATDQAITGQDSPPQSEVADGGVAPKQNRLSRESSPYLLLHAHNPVDWYPWGAAAFEKAREENKPIFLSVGYSSCYWCHVMERTVFSNPRIAAFMNEHFVNVKVDREERPDVDDIYMTSLIVYQQAAGIPGGGGWPLSLFLTPDGNPIAGATYLPPEDMPDGRTGFLTAATNVHELWNAQPARLQASADLIATEVRRLSGPQLAGETVEPHSALVSAAIDDIRQHYDPQFGGVDFQPNRPNAPRFPNVPRLQLLLAAHIAQPSDDLLSIVVHSLKSMASGGIRDHLAGGFHRYSTDRQWHVPHFEKMLYDQAQLLQIYTQAAQITGDPLLTEVAGEIADFVQREFTLPDGGFCSALDAETHAIEGAYYVWTPEQITEALGNDAAVFMTVYGMNQPNPFEHGYVLHLPRPMSEIAVEYHLTEQELRQQLAQSRDTLLQIRSRRERPLLDDKVLTEWNAMMIQGLAMSGKLPGRESDLAAAEKAARFLLKHLRRNDGSLLRSWRNGQAVYDAYLDDYAFLAAALIQLHEATGDISWLKTAQQITDRQIELFYDDAMKTFFYTSHNHEKLIARTSTAYDSTFPSGNSVTARNLHFLSQQSLPSSAEAGEDAQATYSRIALVTLERLCPSLKSSPAACAGAAMAVQSWLAESPQSTGQQRGSAESTRTAAVVLSQTSLSEGHDVRLTAVTTAAAADSGTSEAHVALQSANPPADTTGENNPQTEDESDATSTTVFKPVIPEPGGTTPFARDEKQSRPVQAKIYPLFDKLERGGKCPIAVRLVVDPIWHINANPSNPEFLVPTELKITSPQKIRMTRVKYPEHEMLVVPGEPMPYHVYGGTVTIYGLLEIDAAETADLGELEVTIQYQACNKDTCMPPDKIVLKGKLPLVNPGDPIRKINEDKFPRPKDEEKTDETPEPQ